MAQVKFFNVVKYKGKTYPAHSPFNVADEDIPDLVQSGAIVLSAPRRFAEPTTPPPATKEKDIDEMTVNELRAFAEEKNIEINSLDKKANIIDTIKKALS